MIGGFDGPWPRLLRGFVELGLPDQTRLVAAAPETGAVSAEPLLQPDSNGPALHLVFGAGPGLDEEYTYTLRVVVEPRGVSVLVRSPDTLFHHVWAGLPLESLPARILADLRAHTEAFVAWRSQGGEPGYAERLAIPDGASSPAGADFVRFLDALYRAGHRLDEGPARGWWGRSGAAQAQSVPLITAGLGQDRSYRLGTGLEEDPALRDHRDRLVFAGQLLVALGGVYFLTAGITFIYTIWAWFTAGAPPWAALATTLGGGATSILLGLAGQALVDLRRRWLFPQSDAIRILLIGVSLLVMMPCSGACCVVGLPIGGYTLWLLIDGKTTRLL